MKFQLPWHRSPIGLDLGAHSIKAVQLLRRRNRWEATAALCLPRANPDQPIDTTDLQRISEVLPRQGFYGRRVVVAAPPAKLMSAMLELPARMPGVPMDEIAVAEFCRVNKTEVQQTSVSYWELPGGTRANRANYALAVGVLHEDANALMDLVQSAGLDVAAVDTHSSAGARACLPLASAAPHLTITLDVGYSAITMCVLNAGLIVYERRITQSNLSTFLREVSDEAGVSIEEAQYALSHPRTPTPGGNDEAPDLGIDLNQLLSMHFAYAVEEMQQAMAYVAHQYSDSDPPTVLLFGGGAQIHGLAGWCEATLKLKVRTAFAGDVVNCPAALAGTMTGALVTAAGLAMFEPD